MYDTINSLSRGGVFWGVVVNQWPLPFSLGELDGVVLAMGSDEGLVLVLVPSERLDSSDCLNLQLRDRRKDQIYLAVTITREGRFIAGAHNGEAIDELGAVDALALYVPLIRGQWERVFV